MGLFSFLRDEGTAFGEEHPRVDLGEHYCILTATSDYGMVHLDPKGHFWHRIKRVLRKMTLPSYYHRKCRLFYPSRKSLVDEWKRIAKTKCPFIIHPFSRLAIIKEIIMCFVWPFSFLKHPFYGAFFHNIHALHDTVTYINFACCALLLCFIATNFITGVPLGRNQKHIVLEFKFICKRYLLTFFACDVVDAVPITALYMHFGGTNRTMLYWISIFHCIHLVRTGTYFTYISDMLFLLKWDEGRRSAVFCVIIGILLMHWSACFLIFWPPFMDHMIQGISDEEQDMRLRNRSIVTTYLIALHRGVMHLFSSGLKIEESETFPLTVTFVLGGVFRIYITSLVILAVLRSDKAETECEVFMDETLRYLDSENLSLNIKQRVELFLRNKYGARYTKIRQIERYLSDNLQHEIFLHSVTHLVENLDFFRNMHIQQLNDLLAGLEPTLFLAGDIVVRFNDEASDLYLISHGKLALYTAQGREVMHIHDGAIAGVSGFIQGQQQWTIAAIETTNSFVWRRKDALKFIQKYPLVHDHMRIMLNKIIDEFKASMDEKKMKNTLEDDTICVQIQLRHKKIIEPHKLKNFDPDDWNSERKSTHRSKSRRH